VLFFSFVSKNCSGIVPGIILDEHTNAEIIKSEIKGNKYQSTIGILSRFADFHLKHTKVHNHKSGGILIEASSRNEIKIQQCEVFFNDKVGIHVVGGDSEPFIHLNKIFQNNGPGIKLSMAVKAVILSNQIKLNMNGIEYQYADPQIFRNLIERNCGNGICSKSGTQTRTDGTIIKNHIRLNKKNGICIMGIDNYTIVRGNDIECNRGAGIRVEEFAHANIFLNDIIKNLCQGILIVETASANIEKNNIAENDKANIAFGGEFSNNTTIIENLIQKGRCEGIFAVHAGLSWIQRNTITTNNEGIVCLTSAPEIKDNRIEYNRSNGVVFVDNCIVRMRNNFVKFNDGVGLYIRNKSYGDIMDNFVEKNGLDLAVENYHVTLKTLVKENKFGPHVIQPGQCLCKIY
jgi:F-box protein 11